MKNETASTGSDALKRTEWVASQIQENTTSEDVAVYIETRMIFTRLEQILLLEQLRSHWYYIDIGPSCPFTKCSPWSIVLKGRRK